MTKAHNDDPRAIARQLWDDPRAQAVLQEGFKEAKRYGKGWCLDCFLYAPAGPWGKVGARHLLRGIVPRAQGALTHDERVVDWLLFGMAQVLPPCGHQGRDGNPSFCLSRYPLNYDDVRVGVERLERKSGSHGGFKSLIGLLRESAGGK